MSDNILKLNIDGSEIRVISDYNNEDNDYICLTDIANKFGSQEYIKNWLQNKSTIEFLGAWEKLNNNNFNLVEFYQIKNEAGSSKFLMSVKKWINITNAIGINAKTGKYNSGTYAHKDIAMSFCAWISPEFQLYIIKEFQRLKKEESERKNALVDWNNHRWLSKVNFKIHTDAIQNHIIPISRIPIGKEGIIYASETEMLNKVIFGMTSQEFKQKYPEYINSNMREEIATTKQLQILANLESYNATMIRDGLTQKQRFDKLTIETEEQKKSIKDNNFTKNLSNNKSLFDKQQENLKSDKFIQNIQKDNLEFKDNDFESEIEKIALAKNKKS